MKGIHESQHKNVTPPTPDRETLICYTWHYFNLNQEKKPMKFVLPPFEKAHVLVVGDVMLDRYWYGATDRISPEAPVPVVHVTRKDERPGGAGNVALNIAALGAKVSLVSMVGSDTEAEVLEQKLQTAGIHCRLKREKDKPTITKLRVISHNQQLIRMDFEEAYYQHSENSPLLENCVDSLANINLIVMSDYGKGSMGSQQPIIQAARKAKVPILVDPKGRDFSIYHHATLLTPNYKEFETVVGACHNENEIIEKGLRLIDELGLAALLITRGAHGMTLLRPGEPEFHLPAKSREVYDVTGAGDTVIATLGVALAAGAEITMAVALANRAASIVVGKLGAATVSMPELRRSTLQDGDMVKGVMTEEQLRVVVEDAKAHGEKIVFTNGCFDILHAGHVSYLEKAKALGDRLIVAVNADASVAQLKGANRPINPLERRMSVLAGLAAVDWVVPFTEETPARLIGEIFPNILVKGGDYKPEEIVGAAAVMAQGGTVKVLNFVEGCSTTTIINKIQDEVSV